MSAPAIRTAVIGYGLAGRVFHCPFVAAVPGLELTTIVQRTGKEAKATYPASTVVRSVDEVLSDPRMDTVVVGTPNNTHFDLARQVLQAGKHVVIDKPFATTSAEARELIELAKQRGKIVAPFHNRRFDNDFLTVKQIVDDGLIGRVVTVRSHFDRYRPLQRPNSWKETGGGYNGILFDLAPHLLDQALALFGAPSAITASSRSDRDQSEIDDALDVVLEYGGKVVPRLLYHCSASMLAPDPSPRFLVHGTHGSYRKQGLDPQEAALLGGARPPTMGSPVPWLPEPQTAWGTLTTAVERREPVQLKRETYPTLTGDYRRFYAGVRDAILGTAPLPVPSEDGYRVIRLLELARESSEQRRTLPVAF